MPTNSSKTCTLLVSVICSESHAAEMSRFKDRSTRTRGNTYTVNLPNIIPATMVDSDETTLYWNLGQDEQSVCLDDSFS